MVAVALGRPQKCLPTRVVIPATHLVPLVLGEPSDGLPELSPDEGEGVLDVVAVLVELGSLEPVLRGPEQQLQWWLSALLRNTFWE